MRVLRRCGGRASRAEVLSAIEIDAEAVDDYRLHEVRESEDRARAIERGRPRRNDYGQVLRPLAPSTINQTIPAGRIVLTGPASAREVAEWLGSLGLDPAELAPTRFPLR